jgi:hypothetical protein
LRDALGPDHQVVCRFGSRGRLIDRGAEQLQPTIEILPFDTVQVSMRFNQIACISVRMERDHAPECCYPIHVPRPVAPGLVQANPAKPFVGVDTGDEKVEHPRQIRLVDADDPRRLPDLGAFSFGSGMVDGKCSKHFSLPPQSG